MRFVQAHTWAALNSLPNLEWNRALLLQQLPIPEIHAELLQLGRCIWSYKY